MSSFHQKNHLIENNLLSNTETLYPCPECNKVTMKRIQSDCILNDGTFIPNLEYYYCSSCHAKFYDDAAMEIIELARQEK